jgi:hypothetical protein
MKGSKFLGTLGGYWILKKCPTPKSHNIILIENVIS